MSAPPVRNYVPFQDEEVIARAHAGRHVLVLVAGNVQQARSTAQLLKELLIRVDIECEISSPYHIKVGAGDIMIISQSDIMLVSMLQGHRFDCLFARKDLGVPVDINALALFNSRVHP